MAPREVIAGAAAPRTAAKLSLVRAAGLTLICLRSAAPGRRTFRGSGAAL